MALWLADFPTQLKNKDDKDFRMSHAGNVEVCLIEASFLRASKARAKIGDS